MRNNGASFSRAFRLLKPVQFQRVFTRPRVCSDDLFKLFARNNEVGYPRLGIAVSRQVDRRAVGRNRIKRVVRESFRQRLGEQRASQRAEIEIGAPPGVDVVVVARRAAAGASNKRLFRSLCSLWARLEAARGAPLAAGGTGPDHPGVERSGLAATGSSHG